MTNHVNKGAQKSSVGQFGHDLHSAHEKVLKWNASINLIKEKKKNNKSTYIEKTDAQLTYCASPLQASNHYLIFQPNHIYHTHPLATTA